MQCLRGLESRSETCDARMAEFALKEELRAMGKVMSGVIEEVKVEMTNKSRLLMKICRMGMKL